jgi:hypothetical protein
MNNEPNQRIFKINETIRKIVKSRIHEFEDLLVSIAIDAFRDIVKDEPEDPFQCLKQSIFLPVFEQMGSGSGSDGDDGDDNCIEDEEECVKVITREFDGINRYVFVEDNSTNSNQAVHRREMEDDESVIGDLVGYLDEFDHFWEAKFENGEIVGFVFEDQFQPPESFK